MVKKPNGLEKNMGWNINNIGKNILREKIRADIDRRESEKYELEDEDYDKKPKKRIPISYLLEFGCKIRLEYALEYYKNEFSLLKFHAEGEKLGYKIKLKNINEAWMLMLPIDIQKNIVFLRTRVKYIKGKEILETIKHYPKYSEIIKKYKIK